MSVPLCLIQPSQQHVKLVLHINTLSQGLLQSIQSLGNLGLEGLIATYNVIYTNSYFIRLLLMCKKLFLVILAGTTICKISLFKRSDCSQKSQLVCIQRFYQLALVIFRKLMGWGLEDALFY